MTIPFLLLLQLIKGPRAKYGLCVLIGVPIPLGCAYHRAGGHMLGETELFLVKDSSILGCSSYNPIPLTPVNYSFEIL